MDSKSTNGDRSPPIKPSLVQSIKSFEKCLVDMRSTVLVPTRLNDIDSETVSKSNFHSLRAENNNLFDVYNDLRKTIKILYGEKNHLFDTNFENKSRTDINGNKDHCLPKKADDNYQANDDLLSRFEFHAKHLKTILDQLCGTAEYITGVYKEDVQNMHMNYNHIEYNNTDVKHYYTSNQTKAQPE